ncbi:hypothetical protein ACJANX_002555 [Escherichia coli]|uniref:hypothetical protein n=1 Tax=Escherichia TaxID=561 RepID=UPI0017C41862|nr:hypothetical protein [Escherichia coli]EFI5801631.1 hypothetical protein [Escherichia coli]EFM2325192.1 hypothetical protein [Escherichia coli]EFM3831632.1 hypothetical protein [Escherichia coli]EFM9342674.1 hypothetical protein [Escherichia coli]MCM4242707.1 hypothetical protein [Escherichia coli]
MPRAVIGAVGGAVAYYLADVSNRGLSRIQENRALTVLNIASRKIEEKLTAGETPREDDFFVGHDDNYCDPNSSKAAETFESILMIAKDTYEKQKIKYIGNLYASFCFESMLLPSQMSTILSLAERLSYNDLCYLYIFRNKSLFTMPKLDPAVHEFSSLVVKTGIVELMKLGLIASVDSKPAPLYFANLDVSNLLVQGLGFALYECMGLEEMSILDAYEVVEPLGIKLSDEQFQLVASRYLDKYKMRHLLPKEDIELLKKQINEINDTVRQAIIKKKMKLSKKEKII